RLGQTAYLDLAKPPMPGAEPIRTFDRWSRRSASQVRPAELPETTGTRKEIVMLDRVFRHTTRQGKRHDEDPPNRPTRPPYEWRGGGTSPAHANAPDGTADGGAAEARLTPAEPDGFEDPTPLPAA